MNRRGALAGLLAAATIARGVRAARGGMRTIGYLSGGEGTGEISRPLAELGHVEGRNLRFEVRVAPDGSPRIAAAAADLVRAQVDVLFAFGRPRVMALREATRTIPIVCGYAEDPVGMGLAHSLSRPGMNLTGLSLAVGDIAQFQLALLRKVVPGVKRLVGVTSRVPLSQSPLMDAATGMGISLTYRTVRSASEVDQVFDSLRDATAEAAFLFALSGEGIAERATAAAIRNRIAAIARFRGLVLIGALMSYSLEFSDHARSVASLLDKVLRGADPAGIPFEQPDRTVFVLNRATARAIGVQFPDDMLLRATEIVG